MTIISLKYSFENCFWDPSWNLYEKVDREAYRRRNSTTATAATRGCARWLLRHFLLLPRQLYFSFSLSLAAGSPSPWLPLNFSQGFLYFLLIFPYFSFVFLFFLFLSFLFLSSFFGCNAQMSWSALSPSIMDIQLVKQVVNILILWWHNA